MNKFLDDSNIIKKEDVSNIEFTMETNDIEETLNDNVEEIKQEPKTEMSFNPINNYNKPIICQQVGISSIDNVKADIKDIINEVLQEFFVEKPKTTKELLIDTHNRLKSQLISKEIDIDIAHYLYKNANSNEERKTYERSYTNLEKDIKILKKKIEYIETRVKKGK